MHINLRQSYKIRHYSNVSYVLTVSRNQLYRLSEGSCWRTRCETAKSPNILPTHGADIQKPRSPFDEKRCTKICGSILDQHQWKCVTYFFIIKPTRCTNFPNLLRHETLHVSGSSFSQHHEFIHCTLSSVICHTSLKTAFEQYQDRTAVPSRYCSTAVYNPVLHTPLLNTQWINSWWWAEELPETCRVSCRSKFGKLVHLVGFIIKKCVTMHGHVNVKNMHHLISKSSITTSQAETFCRYNKIVGGSLCQYTKLTCLNGT
jgi:hypothetical protein